MRQQEFERNTGLTLLEMMIVVAVISILVGLAIPSLLDSRKVTNESATIAALRNLCSAQEIHRNRYGSYGSIGDLTTRRLIDDSYQLPSRRGYVFDGLVTGPDSWTATAVPDAPGSTGDRRFYIDESAVIRFNASGDASSNDPAIE